MNDSRVLHQIEVRSTRGMVEALRRLRDHGYDPSVGERYYDRYYDRYPIQFLGPRNADLDFLRPDIIPPKR